MPPNAKLNAPFPWFGGKSRIATLLWNRLGEVANLVIPFAGSLGEFWSCPYDPLVTINDLDAFVCNVYRALQADPEGAAAWADYPVNEADLHARHLWLRAQRHTLTARLMGDPSYYDAKVAGWWLWGIACWIGGGFCGPGGAGPWGVDLDDEGYWQLVHLGNAERGVSRRLVHLGDTGRGVSKRRVHLGGQGGGVGVCAPGADILPWFLALQRRLRRVRVCCGDWRRVLGPSVTTVHGLTAIVFDPPYSAEEDRNTHLYAMESLTVAHDVRAWCLENGAHPLLRLALCGYGEVHDALLAHGWTKVTWKTGGGYGNQGNGRGRQNASREVVYFSPHCLIPTQLNLL